MPSPSSRYRIRIVAEEIDPKNGETLKVMSKLEYPIIDYGTMVMMEDTVLNALINLGKAQAAAIGQDKSSAGEPTVYRDRDR